MINVDNGIRPDDSCYHRYTRFKIFTQLTTKWQFNIGISFQMYSVCSRNFSSTSRDFENTVLYFSNLSKERVFSRSFTSTVLENSRINIFNILYLELGAARLNMMSILIWPHASRPRFVRASQRMRSEHFTNGTRKHIETESNYTYIYIYTRGQKQITRAKLRV